MPKSTWTHEQRQENARRKLLVSMTVATAVDTGIALDPVEHTTGADSTRLFERWLDSLSSEQVSRVRSAFQAEPQDG